MTERKPTEKAVQTRYAKTNIARALCHIDITELPKKRQRDIADLLASMSTKQIKELSLLVNRIKLTLLDLGDEKVAKVQAERDKRFQQVVEKAGEIARLKEANALLQAERDTAVAKLNERAEINLAGESTVRKQEGTALQELQRGIDTLQGTLDRLVAKYNAKLSQELRGESRWKVEIRSADEPESDAVFSANDAELVKRWAWLKNFVFYGQDFTGIEWTIDLLHVKITLI